MPNNNQISRRTEALRAAYNEAVANTGIDPAMTKMAGAMGIMQPTCPQCGSPLELGQPEIGTQDVANGKLNSMTYAANCGNCNQRHAVVIQIQQTMTVTPINHLLGGNTNRRQVGNARPALPINVTPAKGLPECMPDMPTRFDR